MTWQVGAMLAAPLLGLIEFFVAGLGVVFGLSGLRHLRTHPERFKGDRVSCRWLVGLGLVLMLHGAWAMATGEFIT